MDDLSRLLRDALTSFSDMMEREDWRGREREAVSLFAFEFLLPRVGNPPLVSPGQVAIECAVPQVTDGKLQVCKDLVIWPRPRMTVWDSEARPTNAPSAIIEWKVVGYPRASKKALGELTQRDVRWLQSFTTRYTDTLGVAVGINWSMGPKLGARRVIAGKADSGWWIESLGTRGITHS